MNANNKSIIANRGGVSARYWYQARIPVELNVANKILNLDAYFGPKSGKKTHMQISVSSSCFPELIRRMFDCDFEATVEAYSEYLICQKSMKHGPGTD